MKLSPVLLTALSGFCLLASFPILAAAAETPKATLVSTAEAPGALDPSLANEVRAAIDRAVDWLAAQQKEDGTWSDANFPALTALALQATAQSGRTDRKESTDKAVKYLVSCVQPDGGIYRAVPGRKGGGLSNYNTAIGMTALHALNDPVHVKIIQDARKFVAGAQYLGDDDYRGGFGYDKDTQRPYTDLLNTYYSVEAMKVTANVEDSRRAGEKRVDINWDETVKYIEKMQNKPGTADAGGFYYNPTDPKAGTTTNKEGVVVFRSYGSITYAGLLALIHANVTRDDVRVQSAFDWAMKHWSLEENPGMGAQGLYFFYNILAKSLSAYGQDLVPLKDNAPLNWKAEFARKLVSLQKRDEKTGKGYWQNENGRYWESDPVLCTAYALLALEAMAR